MREGLRTRRFRGGLVGIAVAGALIAGACAPGSGTSQPPPTPSPPPGVEGKAITFTVAKTWASNTTAACGPIPSVRIITDTSQLADLTEWTDPFEPGCQPGFGPLPSEPAGSWPRIPDGTTALEIAAGGIGTYQGF